MSRSLVQLLFGVIFVIAANACEASEAEVRQVWQLLDYVSVDYGGAVRDGKVVSDSEYGEMLEFARTSQTKLAGLEERPETKTLIAEAAALVAAVDDKQEFKVVARLARGLADHLIAVYPVQSAPAKAPDVTAAAIVYQSQCASCHGATGRGDGPIGLTLAPRPVAFTDQERARRRSPFALYQVISQGVPGTPMPGFASSLSDDQRWGLAFYLGQFAHSPEDVAVGAKLWADDRRLREEVPSLDAASRSTEAGLAERVGERRAALAMAFVRAHPDAVATSPATTFDLARHRLQQSADAYQRQDLARARDLALSAYLDGVEPSEPALAARDAQLLSRIETGMSKYRSLVNDRAAVGEVEGQRAAVEALLRDAQVSLSAESDPTAAFIGSFTILLREGLEALLVVVAMVAFLRKAERKDMLRYVHGGWLGALALGVVTWAVATYLVNVSGAGREVTEGLSSLFAAVVLLSVGMWMHQKSMAGAWQKYIHEKLSAALNGRSALFIFGLSFVAVYREVFEVILFYAALWEQGNHPAVLGGLVAAVASLLAIGLVILKFSMRLPIAKFFSWSSGLVAVLAVVLTGKGISALQEAGWIGSHIVQAPRISILGIFPSAQALGAQALVLAFCVAGFYWNSRGAARFRASPTSR